jgi:hypothetical protein
MHKRWTLAALLGATAFVLACDDKKFLTERPFDFIGPSNFYNNAGDALAAINGVYADFINSTGDNYYGRNFVMIVEHTTEMWTSRLSATNERMQPDVYAIPVSHAYIQSIWASAYDAINRANSVLVYKGRRACVSKREIIMRAAHSPHHRAGANVDLRHLAQVAKRDEHIAVRVEINRVAMCPVDDRPGAIDRIEDAQIDIEMVKRAPVEQQLAARSAMLHVGAENVCLS